jgi:hypothetical protein
MVRMVRASSELPSGHLDNNVFTGSANGPTLPAGWSLTQR